MTDKVMVMQLATLHQISSTAASKHIAPPERDRLVRQMQGSEPYTPRIGGSDQHLKCRAEHCLNIALGGARKQLCPAHYAAFLERSNATHAKPRCHACNTHTSLKFRGVPTCNGCAGRIVDGEAADRSHDHKMQMLEDATTVHELREWIKDYLL